MSATETTVGTKPLHLPSLAITGFRGINQLAISRLGRVTLLAGKNGVGKTTVLDAVRIFAARGRPSALTRLLSSREEFTQIVDESGDETSALNWEALFYRGQIPADRLVMHEFPGFEFGGSGYGGGHTPVSIGTLSENDRLSIDVEPVTEATPDKFFRHGPYPRFDEDWQMLKVKFRGRDLSVPVFYVRDLRSRRLSRELESEFPPAITCELLGPSLLGNMNLARFWDGVALTDDEDRAVQALRLIFGKEVDRVALIGDMPNRNGRRAIVRLETEDRPVPLKSLGDGAVRLFSVALALANSRDGFLVIDEAENGIHYSVQRDYWKMILKTAHENNVQVLATTHGWDCVVGFAQAATELEEVDAALVRLERDSDGIRAVEYSESRMKVAAESGIEVR